MCSGSEAPGMSTVPRGNSGSVSATRLRYGAAQLLARRPEYREGVGHVEGPVAEPEERGGTSAWRGGRGALAGGLQEPAPGEYALQVGRGHGVAERGHIEPAQLG